MLQSRIIFYFHLNKSFHSQILICIVRNICFTKASDLQNNCILINILFFTAKILSQKR